MIIPKYNEPRIACGSSEGVRDVIIDIDECVRVGSDNGCIDRRVGRRDVAKEEISMSMEESTCESFCEMVREVEFRVDALEQH